MRTCSTLSGFPRRISRRMRTMYGLKSLSQMPERTAASPCRRRRARHSSQNRDADADQGIRRIGRRQLGVAHDRVVLDPFIGNLFWLWWWSVKSGMKRTDRFYNWFTWEIVLATLAVRHTQRERERDRLLYRHHLVKRAKRASRYDYQKLDQQRRGGPREAAGTT